MTYLRLTALLSLTVALALYLFVALPDPYGKIGHGWPTSSRSDARAIKHDLWLAAPEPYGLVILGSSRAEEFDPAQVSALTGLRTFNFAAGGAGFADMEAIVRFVLARPERRPQRIWLHADLLAFAGDGSYTEQLRHSPLFDYTPEAGSHASGLAAWWQPSYFSYGALADAWRGWRRVGRGAAPTHDAAGGLLKITPTRSGPIPLKMAGYFVGGYEQFAIRPAAVQRLRTLHELAQAHGIEVTVSLAPKSVAHLERMHSLPGLAEGYAQARASLREVFGGYYDFDGTALAGYEASRYWIDSVHPSRELAALMVESLFGVPATPIGHWIR